MENNRNKEVYILLSQTGTLISRFLKKITHDDYNHASIALDINSKIFYSFGRRCPYLPVWSGFIEESPNFGTFKRFSKTKALVLSLKVTEEEYEKIENLINKMNLHKRRYGYNYLGLFLAAVNVQVNCKKRFYCSEFVKYVLQTNEITGADNLPYITKPASFMELPFCDEIYCGLLSKLPTYETVTH